jgi:hypothetical protein
LVTIPVGRIFRRCPFSSYVSTRCGPASETS